MPLYEFKCSRCSNRSTLRRPISAMDDAATCRLECAGSLERQFSPNGNIHIPIHFKQWQSNGVPGGGQLVWSDIHEETERELAKAGGIEPTNRARSQSGRQH